MANGKPLGDKANGNVKKPLPDRHKVHKALGEFLKKGVISINLEGPILVPNLFCDVLCKIYFATE